MANPLVPRLPIELVFVVHDKCAPNTFVMMMIAIKAVNDRVLADKNLLHECVEKVSISHDNLEKEWTTINGRLSGRYSHEIYNRDIIVCWYSRGLRHGVFTRHNHSGQLVRRTQYKRGKLHKNYMVLSASGRVTFEVCFNKGVLHGPCNSFFSNGRTSIQYQFVDGVIQGAVRTWYRNGQGKFAGWATDGKLIDNGMFWKLGERFGVVPAKLPRQITNILKNKIEFPLR